MINHVPVSTAMFVGAITSMIIAVLKSLNIDLNGQEANIQVIIVGLGVYLSQKLAKDSSPKVQP